MKKGKNKSRYRAFADLLIKFQKEFKDLTPIEAEQKLHLLLMQNIGTLAKAYTDLAIKATAADLALMTTEVKFLATLGKYSLLNVAHGERQTRNYDKMAKMISDAEKSVQRYFLYKAEQLGLGKKDYKALTKLIQANMPE